jgi:hypothetical protein
LRVFPGLPGVVVGVEVGVGVAAVGVGLGDEDAAGVVWDGVGVGVLDVVRAAALVVVRRVGALLVVVRRVGVREAVVDGASGVTAVAVGVPSVSDSVGAGVAESVATSAGAVTCSVGAVAAAAEACRPGAMSAPATAPTPNAAAAAKVSSSVVQTHGGGPLRLACRRRPPTATSLSGLTGLDVRRGDYRRRGGRPAPGGGRPHRKTPVPLAGWRWHTRDVPRHLFVIT